LGDIPDQNYTREVSKQWESGTQVRCPRKKRRETGKLQVERKLTNFRPYQLYYLGQSSKLDKTSQLASILSNNP
jgi:hypothetical protein